MKVFNLLDMKGGWFVGGFSPTAYHTDACEVSLKLHAKGEQWDAHYHKKAIETNLLIKGEMTICGRKLKANDIFVIEPYEIADPIFHEDCLIVCVKTPCVIGDKYIVDRRNIS